MLSFMNTQSLEWISQWIPNTLWLKDTLGGYIDSRKRQDTISQKVNLVVDHIFAAWLEDKRNERHWRTMVGGKEVTFSGLVEHHLSSRLWGWDITPEEMRTLALVQEVKGKIYDRVTRNNYVNSTQK